MTDWTYPDGEYVHGCAGFRNSCVLGFENRTLIANWVNVAAIVASVFLLVSFAVLPAKWTGRHYLSVCTTLSVLFIDVGT